MTVTLKESRTTRATQRLRAAVRSGPFLWPVVARASYCGVMELWSCGFDKQMPLYHTVIHSRIVDSPPACCKSSRSTVLIAQLISSSAAPYLSQYQITTPIMGYKGHVFIPTACLAQLEPFDPNIFRLPHLRIYRFEG